MELIDIKAMKVRNIQIRDTGILCGIVSVFLGLYTTDKFDFSSPLEIYWLHY